MTHTRGPYRTTPPPLLGPELTGAACKGHAGLWDDHTDPQEPAHTRTQRHTQAIDICRHHCPIRVQCLTARRDDPALIGAGGIYGGQLFTATPQPARKCPCGNPLPDTAPPYQKYCTEQCGDNTRKRHGRTKTITRTNTCAHTNCHNTFTTKLPNQQFCTTTCRRAHWTQIEATRRAEAREQRARDNAA